MSGAWFSLKKEPIGRLTTAEPDSYPVAIYESGGKGEKTGF